jgi:fucose 4-O-acetylase-like acetyltransferase
LSDFLSTTVQAAGTIYYFFVSLIVCLVVTHVAATRTLRFQLAGLVVSTAILSCLPQFSIATGFHALSEYWSPLNFIPLSFAAVLVAQNREYVRSRKGMLLGMLTVLAIMFSKLEWNFSAGDIFFPGDGYSIPPYTRPSLVFAVSAISILALEATVKANAMVTFMAKYALALYCLHLFVVEPVRGLVSRVSQSNPAIAFGSFVLVILASYALAMLLRVYVKEEIIM